MLAPTIIPVPQDTTSFYITAISLCPMPSSVSVDWACETATFGAVFKGPDPNYVLVDSIFGMPVIADTTEPPKEFSLSFNFGDTTTAQHSVAEPITTICGPGGSAKKVMVKGFAAGNGKRERPTTVTFMFTMKMKGYRKPAGEWEGGYCD